MNGQVIDRRDPPVDPEPRQAAVERAPAARSPAAGSPAERPTRTQPEARQATRPEPSSEAPRRPPRPAVAPAPPAVVEAPSVDAAPVVEAADIVVTGAPEPAPVIASPVPVPPPAAPPSVDAPSITPQPPSVAPPPRPAHVARPPRAAADAAAPSHGNGAPAASLDPRPSNGVPGPIRSGPDADDGGFERAATAPQLRRFIKSRAYVPMHELRRRFAINGGDDEVTAMDLERQRVFVGLPEREGRLLAELLRGGDIGFELSLDPVSPIVVGVYPMRPVTRA